MGEGRRQSRPEEELSLDMVRVRGLRRHWREQYCTVKDEEKEPSSLGCPQARGLVMSLVTPWLDGDLAREVPWAIVQLGSRETLCHCPWSGHFLLTIHRVQRLI